MNIYTQTFTLPKNDITSLSNYIITKGSFNNNAKYILKMNNTHIAYIITEPNGASETISKSRDNLCGLFSITIKNQTYQLFVETPNRKATDAFKYDDNNHLILINPNMLSPIDWKYIAKEFNMLGYNMQDTETTRIVFTRLANETKYGYILQPDQKIAIEKLFYHKNYEFNWFQKANLMEQKAIQHFGTTLNHKHAGYITRSGFMLNFSHEGYQRDMDHRDINEIFDEPIESDKGTNTTYMIAFMNLGNIRTSENGLDITIQPTNAQKSIIQNKCRELCGDIYIDFSSPTGSTIASKHFTYGTPAHKIIKQIDTYFQTGFLPSDNI